MKANDYEPTKRIFGLLKGEPGSGKSIAAASFAKSGRTFIFDFDGKFGAIHNYYSNICKHPDILDNIDFQRFDDYNTAVELLNDWIETGCPYKTIIWDTLTTTVDRIMAQVSEIKGINNKNLKKVGDIVVSDIEDYNAESSALTRLLQASKFKPNMKNINFLMLAHVVTTESYNLKEQRSVVTRTLFTAGKKVAAKLPAYFDEIYHFINSESGPEWGGTKYEVFTSNAGVDFARTSLPIGKKLDITGPKLFYDELMKEINKVKF